MDARTRGRTCLRDVPSMGTFGSVNRDYDVIFLASHSVTGQSVAYLGGSGLRTLRRAIWTLFIVVVAVENLHIYARRYPGVHARLSLPLSQAEKDLSGTPYGTS